MNFTHPPSLDDLEVIVANACENMPDELQAYCEGVSIVIEDFPDDVVSNDLDLDDPFDLLALYKSGKEISPGVERKTANDDDVLVVYRRAVLDLWCETCDDLNDLIYQVIVEEFARHFEFSDDEIEELVARHHQGML